MRTGVGHRKKSERCVDPDPGESKQTLKADSHGEVPNPRGEL